MRLEENRWWYYARVESTSTPIGESPMAQLNILGCSQAVKAAVFDTVIHWFKSNQPSHTGQTARSQKEFGFAVCLKEIVVLPFLPIGILQKGVWQAVELYHNI